MPAEGGRSAAAALRPPLIYETLAAAPSAQAALQQWQQSPAHLQALLSPQASRAGLGVSRRPGDGAQLWTLLLTDAPPHIAGDCGGPPPATYKSPIEFSAKTLP